jgi:DNA-binding CsgD family transcriptional regulator
LTDRELEIFRLLGRGMARARIAAELNLSVKTIEAHRASIRQKLRLGHRRAPARRRVPARGIVSPVRLTWGSAHTPARLAGPIAPRFCGARARLALGLRLAIFIPSDCAPGASR